jgi:lipopolysaccharide biosynthesis glycosyltransferase
MFSKLWAFALTGIGRIVYLDADCLVLGDIDALFAETGFSAAPDLFTAGTRTFNAGVFTVAPTAAMRRDLYAAIAAVKPESGSDQALLNVFFADWVRLPVCYNFLRTYGLVSGPFRDSRMRVLHYVSNKPWTFRKQVMADMVLEPFDRLWTERLTDAEHDELSRDWRARLDEFEARFPVISDVRAEIDHAREILADDLRRTRRRLYLAIAVAMAATMAQTAVIVALLLR